jgi:hypothetical protein
MQYSQGLAAVSYAVTCCAAPSQHAVWGSTLLTPAAMQCARQCQQIAHDSIMQPATSSLAFIKVDRPVLSVQFLETVCHFERGCICPAVGPQQPSLSIHRQAMAPWLRASLYLHFQD